MSMGLMKRNISQSQLVGKSRHRDAEKQQIKVGLEKQMLKGEAWKTSQGDEKVVLEKKGRIWENRVKRSLQESMG